MTDATEDKNKAKKMERIRAIYHRIYHIKLSEITDEQLTAIEAALPQKGQK